MTRSLDSLRRTIERRLAAGRLRLPPFPAVAHEVLRTAADPMAGAQDLARLIHRDPGLAAETLRVANSAAYVGRVPSVSLQQAIARLGSRQVVEIAVTASVRDGIFHSRGFEEEQLCLWHDSLATSLYAKEVARLLREDVEAAFLGGLLRRVGTALLFHALTELRSPHDPRLQREEILALDAELRVGLGSAAVEAWKLPDHVARVIRAEEESKLEEVGVGPLVVLLASRLATLIGESDPDKAEALRDDVLLDELGIYPDDLERLLAFRDEVREAVESSS